MERILVIGANGQIGSELVGALALQHGADNVIASDIGTNNLYQAKRYAQLNVLDKDGLAKIIADEDITQVYQLAAMLSATGEAAPLKAWSLNMDGLLNILELARERGEAGKPLRIFWPSSIAAFGPNTPASEHAANDGDGPDLDVRHQQAGRRAPVRVLLQQVWRGRAQHPLPGHHQLQIASGRRHHRLRHRHLPRGLARRTL